MEEIVEDSFENIQEQDDIGMQSLVSPSHFSAWFLLGVFWVISMWSWGFMNIVEVLGLLLFL
jgi:hypothetical protein